MAQRTNPNLPVHDGRSFEWDRGIGYAEVSDLMPRLTDRVYPDAADEGFYVLSHKTGVKKLFFAVGDRRMGEDVASWLFKSEDGFGIEIFND